MPVRVFTSITSIHSADSQSFVQSQRWARLRSSWTNLLLPGGTMGCCKGDEILLTPNHPALCLQERFIRLDWWERSVSLSHLKTHHVPLTKQSPWNHRRSTPASSSGRRLGSKQNRRAGGRVYSAWGRGSESERFHEWGGTEFPPEPIDGEHTHITYMKRKHSHNTYILYMQYNAIIY